MAQFDVIKNQADSPSQVRRIAEAVAFLAPSDAPLIESLTDASGELVALPEDYIPVGIVSRDGYTFGGDTETETTDAYGYTQPVREDIVGQARNITFTAFEVYRRDILALVYGMDLSEVTQAVSGEVTFDRPALPDTPRYRLIVIGRDGRGDKEVFRAKHYPSVAVTSIPEEAWGTTALQFEVTLTAYVDDEAGTAEREFIAGKGAVGALDFEAATENP